MGRLFYRRGEGLAACLSLAATLHGMAGKAQPEVGREGSSRAKASRLAKSYQLSFRLSLVRMRLSCIRLGNGPKPAL